MKNKYLYLLVVFILFICYLITGTYYLLISALFLFLIGLISAFFMYLNVDKVHVRLIAEDRKWALLYRAQKPFPLGRISVETNVYNCFFDRLETIECEFLTGEHKMVHTLDMESKLGIYRIQNIKVILWDLLSNVSKRLGLGYENEIYIRPKHTHVEGIDEIRSKLEQRNNEKSDDYDVRDYREGDILKDIHHKLSFKMAKLMVKEKLKKNDDKISLFIDLSGDEEECIRVFSYFHAFMEFLQFYDEVCIIGWYSKNTFHKETIKTMSDKERLVRRILSMPKAEVCESQEDMWVLNPSGLHQGEVYE